MEKIEDWAAILERRGFVHNEAVRPKHYRVIGDGWILEAFAGEKYYRISEYAERDALFEKYDSPGNKSKGGLYNRNPEFSKRLSHGDITKRLKEL